MPSGKKLLGRILHPAPGLQIAAAVLVTAGVVMAGERLVLGLAGVTPAVKESWIAMADVAVAAALFTLTFVLVRIERQRDRPRFEIRKARIGFGGEDPSGGMSLFFEIANLGGVDSCLDEETVLVKVGMDEFKPSLDFAQMGLPMVTAAGHDTREDPLMIPVGHVRRFEAWFTNSDNLKLFTHLGSDVTLWLNPVADAWVGPKTFRLEPGEPPSRSVIFFPDAIQDDVAPGPATP